MVEDNRPGVIYRSYDVVRSVDVGGTDYLDGVIAVCRDLCHYGCHVLEHVRAECRLDDEYVIVSLHCRNYPEIVHIAVPVEVKVGNDV